jgi:hypothetical protein
VSDLQTLAYEIADDAATSCIESNCLCGPNGRWWDIGTAADAEFYVLRDVCYLEARGKLRRHPKTPNLVQIVEQP